MKKVIFTILGIAAFCAVVTFSLIFSKIKKIDKEPVIYDFAYELPPYEEVKVPSLEDNIADGIYPYLHKELLEIDDTVSKIPFVNYKNTELAFAYGVKFNDYYDENSILVEEVNLYDEEYFDKHGMNYKMPQVHGFKDEDTEVRINNRIKECYLNILDEGKYDKVFFEVYGNFSNLLSLGIGMTDTKDNNYNVYYDYLNFDLRNGSEISFGECFVNTCDVTELLRESLYRELSLYNLWNDDDFDDLPYDTFCDENKYYEITKYIMEQEDLEFGITEGYVFVSYKYDDDYSRQRLCLIYEDHPEYFAVYDRFLTDESLFTGEYYDEAAHHIFQGAYGDKNHTYGFVTDNFFLDFNASQIIMYESDDMKEEQLVNCLDKSIEEYRKLITKKMEEAKDNPDKVYLALCKASGRQIGYYNYIGGYYDFEVIVSNSARCSKTISIYEMDRKYFDEVYQDKLSSAYRHYDFEFAEKMFVEGKYDDSEYVPVENPNVKIESDQEYFLINFATGEKFENFLDCIKDKEEFYDLVANKLEVYNGSNLSHEEGLSDAKEGIYHYDLYNFWLEYPHGVYYLNENILDSNTTYLFDE